MSDRVPFLARRSVLTRGVAGLAAGLALFASRTDGRPTGVASSGTTTAPRDVQLYGRGWRAHADDLKFGELPKAGERYAVYGDLADGPNGKKIGEFASAVFTLAAHGSTVEMHTLNLASGSIIGMGSGSGAKRTFAIVGGTGEYTGARGSYVVEQDIYGFGGTGAAKLSLTLTTED
ncbi:MAG: hypothetical protein M3O80_01970 [Chloroflexota bacterium]|nr:hypothetical protein [Chloroflexota bacterium]